MQATRANTRMKNLIKGLRCLSQAFEKEKEEEMKIGNPTDVKHIAHIGYDGPSTTNPIPPTQMNEFKSSEDVVEENNDSSSVKCRSESCGVNLSKDLQKPPKTTTKSMSEKVSPTKTDKSDKSTKRRSSSKATSSSRRFKEKTTSKLDQDSSENIPKIKTKRKKAKDVVSVNGACCSIRSSKTTSDFDDSFTDSASASVKSLSRFNDDREDIF